MRYSTPALVLGVLSSIALACGGPASSTVESSTAPLTAADLAGGSWTTLQLSRTAGTISHDGRLAFLPSGRAVALWSEPDAKDYSIQNIWTATLDAGSWTKSPALTTNTATQNAFPALVPVGEVVHAVWNGAPSGDNDIFHGVLAGSAWSAPADLTSAFKTDGATRTDYLPATTVSKGGALAVAYNSKPAKGPIDIRALRLGADGAPLGAPFVAIAPGDAAGDCYGATAEHDADGHLHVVAECGPLGREHLLWATDASGSWVVGAIDAQGASDVQAELVRGPGRSLELVWTAFSACGGYACGDIMTATIEGTQIGPARHVTSTPDASEVSPHAVVDATGRLIVGYTSNRDSWLVWSTGATTFSEPKNLTPDTPSTWELLSSIALDPTTGTPHVLYTKVLPGTQPLNAEIMHTFWVAR